MVKDLSNDQISSMKEAFTLFDTDGDGKIAPSKLGILMRSLGGNPTQAQLKSIIAEEKLTAPFDFNRFLDLMSKHLKPEPFDRQLHDAFKVLDKDGIGFDVVSDLKHILTSIGEKLEPPEFDEWIREAKMGGKGKKRREKNYRATHGGTTRLPPPPTPSSLDALPSKLRQIMAFQVLGKLHPIMQIGRKEMKE